MLTDNRDGTHLAQFTCYVEGEYFVDVKLGRVDIIQSPFVLTVDPGPTEPSQCVAVSRSTVHGDGLKGGEAGRPLVFVIQAMDKYGNRVSAPGDDFQIKITEVIENIRVRAKVVDQGDGTYEVTWVGLIRGEYEIRASLREEEIKGSPWTATISTGKAAPAKCTAEGLGLAGTQAGVPVSVLVESNDHYGNVVTMGGAEVEGSVVSVDGKHMSVAAVQDHLDGTYTVTYDATVMGDYFLAIKVDGEHIHESPFLVFIDHTGACVRAVGSWKRIKIDPLAKLSSRSLTACGGITCTYTCMHTSTIRALGK